MWIARCVGLFGRFVLWSGLLEVHIRSASWPLFPWRRSQLRNSAFVPPILQGSPLHCSRGYCSSRNRHDVRIGVLLITYKESGQPSLGDVAMRIMLRPLNRLLEEDAFPKANETLAKCAATES